MFVIQDGHQAHTGVGAALAAGYASGAVWSLSDQTPANLDVVCAGPEITREGNVQAIDPQMYVAPLLDANPKKLLDHGLFSVPMRPRDFSARHLVELVEQLLAFQTQRPVTHMLSPTVAIGSMADRWAGIAANLAETAIESWSLNGDARPLLVSVAIQQSLLADPDNVDALLDELTAYECEGFYLLFEISPRTDPAQAAVLMHRALYIVHTLAQVNEYETWVGYSGIGGYVYRAAGANVTAGGWWQKQNWWSPSHWTAGGGGRSPRPRIYLESLLGSLLIDAELSLVARQRTDPSLYTALLGGGGPLSDQFAQGRPFDGQYARAEMTMQLYAVCSSLDRRITGDVQADLRRVLHDIATAEDLYRRIQDVGVQVEAGIVRNAPVVWQMAITAFAAQVGLNL